MDNIREILHKCLTRGIPLDPLPVNDESDYDQVPHAPKRNPRLSPEEFKQAVKNALRYFPHAYHAQLAPEFAHELRTEGHIYMRRFRPREYAMKAYPLEVYPTRCPQAAAIMLMLMNNLDPQVAQYPHELITYGGNGSVLSNWAQYHLLMQYLSQLTPEQTLQMSSGHPVGLFPSGPTAPRMVLSNGMVIPNYSSKEHYDKFYAMGVSMYGQMTAGSYCYIGPQGIVHGTTLVVLNAGRKYLQAQSAADMAGKVYVSSGLGGMSGAQGKAARVCGAVSVIAEVDLSALEKRHRQGWIDEIVSDLDGCITRLREARAAAQPLAIGFHGNVVALWEALAEQPDMLVDLGSDQTSLHNPFNGGYYPVQISLSEARKMMSEQPDQFRQLVRESLCRQVAAINRLVERGMRFWDYGNSFMLEASRAGADIMTANGQRFRYPTYFQEFMGDIFSLGFGPFRWVCCSGSQEDLALTDQIALEVMTRLREDAASEVVAQQYTDNIHWIEHAQQNNLVVGSQARILYSDARGRVETALAFNQAIRDGRIKGPVVLSRDHHDVSGTDSPYRETSNITDGSQFTADMAVQNVIGDSFRGATWVALHNGGGCGWGEVINGGFGLVLDGSDLAASNASNMLAFDVLNGVTRRAWSGNANAHHTIQHAMQANPLLSVTLPHHADEAILNALVEENKVDA